MVCRCIVFNDKDFAAPKITARQAPCARSLGQIQLEVEPECGPLAVLALDLDGSAHHACEFLRDGKTKAGSAKLARGRLVGLLEGPEQFLQLLVGDADTCIAHGEPQEGRGFRFFEQFGGDANFTGFGEFDGIVRQIDQDLAKAERIATEIARQIRWDFKDQLETLGGAAFGHDRGNAFQNFIKLEVGLFQDKLTGLDLREVENIIDDLQQVTAGLVDLPGIFRLYPVEVGPEQQVRHADDRVERCPDLVAHIREEQ